MFTQTMEKTKICRLCLAQPQISYSLQEKDGASILESLTSIKIDEDDNLPKRACLKCWLNLKLAFRIQQNFLEVDKKLQLLIFEKETEEIENHEEFEYPGEFENTKKFENPKEIENFKEIVDVPSPVQLMEPSLETLAEDLDQSHIKQEHFDIIHKDEPSSEPESSEMDTKDYGIKVENLTEGEVLIICQTETSDNVPSKVEFKISGPTSCHICGSGMSDQDMIEHLKTHYNSRLKCDECNTYCENITSYRKHILSQHEDMQKHWRCKICSAIFQYKPLYKIHIEQAHLNDAPLKRHRPSNRLFAIEDIQDYKYDCPYCKRKFKSEERSLAHIKTHNKKECPICHAKITPANFKVHVDSHNSQPVICHLCGVSYKNQTSLRSHIYYTHSTRKYVCKYCKKVFKKAYDLPLHIKKEHTGQKDHVCDICGKSFFTFHTLNTHTKMTHMKLRPFQCQYCKKKFSSKHSVTTHERQHTNVTPYSCEVCGEGFRQNVSLRAHKKSKHNIVEEKTCACKVCGKKFGTEWAVLSHMRIH